MSAKVHALIRKARVDLEFSKTETSTLLQLSIGGERALLQVRDAHQPMVDEQVRNSVVGDDCRPAGGLSPRVQRENGDAETNVGRDDLLVVSVLKDDGGRVEICRNLARSAKRQATAN